MITRVTAYTASGLIPQVAGRELVNRTIAGSRAIGDLAIQAFARVPTKPSHRVSAEPRDVRLLYRVDQLVGQKRVHTRHRVLFDVIQRVPSVIVVRARAGFAVRAQSTRRGRR